MKPRARYVPNREKSYWVVWSCVAGFCVQGVGLTFDEAYCEWRLAEEKYYG